MVFAAIVLLWNEPVINTQYLTAWVAAESALALVAFASFWSVQVGKIERFVFFSRIESLGTAINFAALPWLGSEAASSTPSKHVLLIGLIAVTSISAANSSHITRRRPFFWRLIVIVGLSFTVAFVLAGEALFAVFSVMWCGAIAALTRVGYHGMLELLELRRASERSARHDDLTGLLSRSAFFESLRTATDLKIATGPEQVVLTLFDLDGFKAINDSFGHAVGDDVLQTVANRLTVFLPEGASIGRLGGDEFAAVFASEHHELRARVDQALSALAEPIRVQGRELYIAGSAGWTIVDPAVSAAELMAQADAAMYQSKNSRTAESTGFDNNLRDQLDRSLDLRQRFRSALKRNEIDFSVQPLVRLTDRLPVAVELLARWPQSDNSFVGPEEFTRVADETGLAVDLDRRALERAAALLATWQHDDFLQSVVVKVNISPVHLHNDKLLQSVQEIVPRELWERLGLEFVESQLITAATRNRRQLQTLLDMGVTLSIDDFGVGYSSLTYLRSLPVSELKIDRSFVTDIDSDPINQGLMRAIVDIASTLGLPTVAEGIETEAEFAAAARLGISTCQGYLVGRPAPMADATDQVLQLRQDSVDAHGTAHA